MQQFFFLFSDCVLNSSSFRCLETVLAAHFFTCCCCTSRLTIFSTHPYVNICVCASVWVCACVLLCLDSIFMKCPSALVTPNVSRSLQTLIKHRILTNPFGTFRDYNDQCCKAAVLPTNLQFLFLALGEHVEKRVKVYRILSICL